jgi:putative FmdB family regulatory protein
VPRYDFQCIKCNELVVIGQSIHDDLKYPSCCGIEMRRVYTPVGAQFKGNGFYVTDNRR